MSKKILCKLFGHQWRHTSTTPHHDLYTENYECVVCKAQKTNFTEEKKRNLFLEFILTIICAGAFGLWYANWDLSQYITIIIITGIITITRYISTWIYVKAINLIYKAES